MSVHELVILCEQAVHRKRLDLTEQSGSAHSSNCLRQPTHHHGSVHKELQNSWRMLHWLKLSLWIRHLVAILSGGLGAVAFIHLFVDRCFLCWLRTVPLPPTRLSSTECRERLHRIPQTTCLSWAGGYFLAFMQPTWRPGLYGAVETPTSFSIAGRKRHMPLRLLLRAWLPAGWWMPALPTCTSALA